MTDPPPFFPPTGQEMVLLLLGVVAVGAALLVVATKQLVHAALWLVVSFGALAGCYLVLTAEFVAWVQVLIYVGAVIVLLLFGIMLTRAPIGRAAQLDSGNAKLASAVALATAGVLVTVVVDGFRTAYAPLAPGAGAAGALGASIFRTWVLPFEALSVLLLAALIGAIVLSRTDIRGDTATPSTDTARQAAHPGSAASEGPTTRPSLAAGRESSAHSGFAVRGEPVVGLESGQAAGERRQAGARPPSSAFSTGESGGE